MSSSTPRKKMTVNAKGDLVPVGGEIQGGDNSNTDSFQPKVRQYWLMVAFAAFFLFGPGGGSWL